MTATSDFEVFFSPLLQAYSVYDEEIGYCQGQSFLAAVLLLHVSSSTSSAGKRKSLQLFKHPQERRANI